MSVLFTPFKIGQLELKNRFVHSATYEAMASDSGQVTDKLIKRYGKLAKGGAGLIIPGYMYIHPYGKSYPHQTGIHDDSMVSGLKQLVDEVHREGGSVIFQLAHGGMQTKKALIGRDPRGPSKMKRNIVTMSKTKAMSTQEIHDVILNFKEAAYRAVEAGTDGIQLHACHGYLLNQFLSPFYNKRTDDWGGTDEKRFRLIKEIIVEIKKIIPSEMPLLVKLNTHDHTPQTGIIPTLAATYAEWLDDLGVNGIEVSCGTLVYSFMNTCRGTVPVEELLLSLPAFMRIFGRRTLGKLQGKFNLTHAYNLDAARVIKPRLKQSALILVGGLRQVSAMIDIISKNQADLISMSRPFIREPHLVKKIESGEMDEVSCISCNNCLAAPNNDIPVLCYVNGFPGIKK